MVINIDTACKATNTLVSRRAKVFFLVYAVFGLSVALVM